MPRQIFIPNTHCMISGCIVPYDQINGMSLAELETTLGFTKGRLDRGAAFAQLHSIPLPGEIDYYGDTRSATHNFNKVRNQAISHADLSQAAYNFFQPSTRLIKVIALKNDNPLVDDDTNYPKGHGAMQFKLKVPKPATIIKLIENYPHGRLN